MQAERDWIGIFVSERIEHITLILFADDVVLFGNTLFPVCKNN